MEQRCLQEPELIHQLWEFCWGSGHPHICSLYLRKKEFSKRSVFNRLKLQQIFPIIPAFLENMLTGGPPLGGAADAAGPGIKVIFGKAVGGGGGALLWTNGIEIFSNVKLKINSLKTWSYEAVYNTDLLFRLIQVHPSLPFLVPHNLTKYKNGIKLINKSNYKLEQIHIP